MTKHARTGPVYIEAWKQGLRDLAQMYEFAGNEGIPIVLVVFPHTFQLGARKFQEPQRILREHADLHGISYLDMTEVAERLIADGVPKEDLFLDRDHYTVQGHGVVAGALLEHLKSNDIF